MDNIIDKLKKNKQDESILDALVKEKDSEKKTEAADKERANDIEVREIQPASKQPDSEEIIDIQQLEEKPVREFRTEGMHEFDFESLGASSDAHIKSEYKIKVSRLIDENEIEEAIGLLQELKAKLAKEKETQM